MDNAKSVAIITDNTKKFKSALFGFSKKSVNDYVVGLHEDFSKKIAELEQQIKEANAKIAEKDAKIAELDAQRLHLAETILKSKVEAEQIVDSAQQTASTLVSDAENRASVLMDIAKNEAQLIVDGARTEAVDLKRTSEDELKKLEEQKEYVAQCINSLKLDVLSAYEVYMLKLEKSMEHHDVLELEEKPIEVEAKKVEESVGKAPEANSGGDEILKPAAGEDFNF